MNTIHIRRLLNRNRRLSTLGCCAPSTSMLQARQLRTQAICKLWNEYAKEGDQEHQQQLVQALFAAPPMRFALWWITIHQRARRWSCPIIVDAEIIAATYEFHSR